MSSASHEMNSDDKSDDRDREPSAGAGARFPLALFVMAELVCTGALIAWLLLS
jgi:hypothetical protein